MMNENERKEAQRRLNEEERIRRLREGGESMKAQLAMEEAQRSSREPQRSGSLTSEEEQQRRSLSGTGEPYRGYGETQQAEQAMWGKRREEEMRAPSGRNISQDEMRRTGSDQVNYPAGGGSYYTETFEKPTGSAGPESSFGRTERIPSGRQYAEGGMGAGGEPSEAEVMQGRMGARPTEETTPTSKMGQTAGAATGTMKEKGGEAMAKGKEKGGEVMAKGKEVGGTVVAKTKDVTSQLQTKAREYSESGKAEDTASRAGEALGRAIRKTVAVAKGMTSGVKKGLNPEEKEMPSSEGKEMVTERRTEGEVYQRETEAQVAPRMERETVEREEIARKTPQGEERKYQEVRRKQNE